MKKQIIRLDSHTPTHISLKMGDYLKIQSDRPISELLIDIKKTTKDEVVLQFLNKKPNLDIPDIWLTLVKDDYPY